MGEMITFTWHSFQVSYSFQDLPQKWKHDINDFRQNKLAFVSCQCTRTQTDNDGGGVGGWLKAYQGRQRQRERHIILVLNQKERETKYYNQMQTRNTVII